MSLTGIRFELNSIPSHIQTEAKARLNEREITVRAITLSVKVITLPVSDVGRAIWFCVDRVGFTFDVDYSPNDVLARRALHV